MNLLYHQILNLWNKISIIIIKEYYLLIKDLIEIDLSKIKEEDDETNLTGELACAGGACEIV